MHIWVICHRNLTSTSVTYGFQPVRKVWGTGYCDVMDHPSFTDSVMSRTHRLLGVTAGYGLPRLWVKRGSTVLASASSAASSATSPYTYEQQCVGLDVRHTVCFVKRSHDIPLVLRPSSHIMQMSGTQLPCP